MTGAKIFTDESTEWIEDAPLLAKVIEYALIHSKEDPVRLRLACAGKPDAELYGHAIDQIEARRRYSGKLPLFTHNPEMIFPSMLAGEQSSAEEVALYHAYVAASLPGGCSTVADITAGLGIDSMALAPHSEVTAFEMDPLKAAALRHNAAVNGLNPLKVINSDSIEWLRSADSHFDLIFADPARRGGNGMRVYDPKECLPDVVGLNDFLLERAKSLLVKHSPMLDISMAVRMFANLACIHVVSLRGECKEVLTEQYSPLINASAPGSGTQIVCVDISADGKRDIFRFEHCNEAYRYDGAFADEEMLTAGNYLYKPGATVMKCGCHGALRDRFRDLKKLDRDTHLYVSPTLYRDFPGRVLSIDDIPDKKRIGKLKGERFNVAVRNYVMDAQALEKRLKVKSGGNRYIYGTRCCGKPILITASEILERVP